MPSEPFVTYAQNCEDVLLWRALKHVERGFYIDVGAQDPVNDSVTKAFYDRGWRGINIEPVSHWYQRLVSDRPRDVNLQLAVAEHAGEMELFEVTGTGLSTTDSELGAKYQSAGETVRKVTVPCRTLDAITAELDIDAVHFLKIDCEGAERSVLEGMSLTSLRPWVVVVEATEPRSLTPNHQHWEHLLVGRGYGFVYFDGLNRYYVADEHAHLRDVFGVPPSPAEWSERGAVLLARQECDYWVAENRRREESLDHFRKNEAELRKTESSLRAQTAGLTAEVERLRSEVVQMGESRARLQADAVGLTAEVERLRSEVRQIGESRAQLQAKAVGLTTEVEQLRSEVRQMDELRSQLQNSLSELYTSRSWRLTAPLRLAHRILAVVERCTLAVLRVIFRPFARALRPLLRRWSDHRTARWLVVRVLGRDSRLIGHARAFLFGVPSSPTCEPDPPATAVFAQAALAPVVWSQRERSVARALCEGGMDINMDDRTSCG